MKKLSETISTIVMFTIEGDTNGKKTGTLKAVLGDSFHQIPDMKGIHKEQSTLVSSTCHVNDIINKIEDLFNNNGDMSMTTYDYIIVAGIEDGELKLHQFIGESSTTSLERQERINSFIGK